VSALTIGGGYVMLPLLRREIVERRGWVTDTQLLDYYALGQSIPGVIAVNTAALVGFRQRGAAGAVASALGMLAPSVLVIVLLAPVLLAHFDTPWVRRVFFGVRAAVTALIGTAVWGMAQHSVNTPLKGLILVAAFAAVALGGVSPLAVLAVSALLGVVFMRREREGEEDVP